MEIGVSILYKGGGREIRGSGAYLKNQEEEMKR
jgi:hypothetical protein